jgi:hypothetical protein
MDTPTFAHTKDEYTNKGIKPLNEALPNQKNHSSR